jgi:hypothetical protein
MQATERGSMSITDDYRDATEWVSDDLAAGMYAKDLINNEGYEAEAAIASACAEFPYAQPHLVRVLLTQAITPHREDCDMDEDCSCR